MVLTSSQAAKLLRKFNDERNALIEKEALSKTYLKSVSETVPVKPDYDFNASQDKLYTIEKKIRNLKHAVNLFNTSTKVEGFDMTVDSLLVYIPQLSQAKDRLYMMQSELPAVRVPYGGNSSVIDYRYANYSIEDAKAEYEKVSDELAKAQTALDLINSTVTFEVDI